MWNGVRWRIMIRTIISFVKKFLTKWHVPCPLFPVSNIFCILWVICRHNVLGQGHSQTYISVRVTDIRNRTMFQLFLNILIRCCIFYNFYLGSQGKQVAQPGQYPGSAAITTALVGWDWIRGNSNNEELSSIQGKSPAKFYPFHEA